MDKFIKERVLKLFNDNNFNEQYQIVNSYVEFEDTSIYIFSAIMAGILSCLLIPILIIFSFSLSQFLIFSFLSFIPFFAISLIPSWFIDKYQKQHHYPIMNKSTSFVTQKKKALQFIRNGTDLLKDLKNQYILKSFLLIAENAINVQEKPAFINKRILFEQAIATHDYLEASRILFKLYPQMMATSGLVGHNDPTEEEKRNLYAQASLILEFLETDSKVNNLAIKEIEKEFNF